MPTMAYVEGRVVHDADAHLMETPTWLRDHAEARFRDDLPILSYPSGNELRQTGDPDEQQHDLAASFDRLRATARLATSTAATRLERSCSARTSRRPAAFIAEDRPRALDLLGFSSQLIFNTFHNSRLYRLEHEADLDLAYAPRVRTTGASSSSAASTTACCPPATSRSPIPSAPSPRPPRRSSSGAAAILIASGCPPRCSPSHPDFFGVWAQVEEADVPVVFHVGGTGELIDPSYFVNGLPIPHDFHGGDENFRSVDYMGIPVPPAQTLATLIFDGVLERFSGLRIGVMEQGAIWVPSWLRQLESAFEAFARHEERLRALSMRPSEYVHRQVRFTPYPTEDVGWIVGQGGADLVLFCSDYPHVEGGRRPVERFEASLGGASEDVRRAFYADNFLFLMGERTSARLAA